MAEHIHTLNPNPDQHGESIELEKYNAIRDAIKQALSRQGPMTLAQLTDAVSQSVKNFEGAVSWYVAIVKLDMEAREQIERLDDTAPHKVRLLEPPLGTGA